MQAGSGFVEHIERVDQVRSECLCQQHPASFSAGKCAERAVQGQVVQPGPMEAVEPSEQGIQDGVPKIVGEVSRVVPVAGQCLSQTGDRHCRETIDRGDFGGKAVRVGQVHRQGVGLQASSVAGGAGVVGPPTVEEDPDRELVTMPLEPVEKPIKSSKVPFGHSVGDQREMFRREFREWHVDRDAVVGRQGNQLVKFVGVGRCGPGHDGSLAEAQTGIGDELGERDDRDTSETAAGGAGPQRAVETEQPGLGSGEPSLAPTAGGARRPGRDTPGSPVEGDLSARRSGIRIGQQHQAAAISVADCLLDTFLDPASVSGPRGEPVEDDPGGFEPVIVDVVEIHDAAVPAVLINDRQAAKPLLGQLWTLLLPVGLVGGHLERDLESQAIREVHKGLGDRVDRRRFDGDLAFGTDDGAGPCEQQRQQVMDLRRRAHRLTGTRTAGALANGDCRWHRLDSVGVGPVESFEQSTG